MCNFLSLIGTLARKKENVFKLKQKRIEVSKMCGRNLSEIYKWVDSKITIKF